MMPLFDMLAQNGKAMELLARQFSLSQQQAQLAVEALMPAFSQGLKRNTGDPYGMAAFMNAMATGGHAKYFEDASKAFSPQGIDQGNDLLGQFFGSKEISRAVAEQAARATGIGQDILKQMLPVIASMIMGGLFKQSTAQAGGFGGNPLGDMIEQMMRQSGGQQQTRNPASPFDNPFGKVLEGMFGGAAQPQAKPAASESPFGDNPFGRIFEEMMGGGQRAADTPTPHPKSPPKSEPTKNPYEDIFGQMFEAGAKQQEEYQKGVESIFDQFKRGMDRKS